MGIELFTVPQVARRIVKQFAEPLVAQTAQELRVQLLAESRRQFNDDTGELRRTIRVENGDTVAIGDSRHDYWQYVARKTRGNGRRWVRKVLDAEGAQTFARAGQSQKRLADASQGSVEVSV